ncbi:hypothetical protein R5R35_004079 [Gryllus longicercus]|uniref:Reverse transcriptase domain-containing protein n=1 Tax=Gryllus longicercus TaxID=2509291 RepID=A0AAN9Z169_9ORTH
MGDGLVARDWWKKEQPTLSRGLNFAVVPSRVPTDDVIAAVETAIRSLPEDIAEDIRRDTCTILARSAPPRCNIPREERLAIRELKRRDDVILPADKGNATVVMSSDYHNKMVDILSDGDTYQKLEKNPLPKVRQKVMAIIGEASSINAEDKRRLKLANNNRTPRIYGLPKIHKPDVPLRPIVSAINSPSQHLARFLTNKLKPLTNNLPSTVLNSKHFIEHIRSIRTNPGDILVSFDVTSLFTMVPVCDAIKIVEDNLKKHQLPTEWAKLAEVCLSTTFFQYRQEFYAQIDGTAMGSPLSPVVANLFIGAFEEQALENAPLKPTLWLRYVDDTFVIWPHGSENLQTFLAHLNSIHPRIRFTMETELHGQLPFLDVLISRRPDGTLGHSVYRKPTHTNRYLHADSHHHPATKRGVLTTLTYRAALISDTDSLNKEKETLRETFLANGYSTSAIQRAL